jgi:hypothetical protein
MPMQSQAQRAYLWSHHPEVARKFEAETPEGKRLPRRKKKKGARGGSGRAPRPSLAAALADREKGR